MAEAQRVKPVVESSDNELGQDPVADELLSLRERLDRLEDQLVKMANARPRPLLNTAAERLMGRKEKLEERFHKATRLTRRAGTDLKDGLGLAWRDIRKSVGSATSRFFPKN